MESLHGGRPCLLSPKLDRFCVYEADFTRCADGWRIEACRVTTDANMYVCKSSRWESLNLEYLIRAALLSQEFDEVEGLLNRAMAIATAQRRQSQAVWPRAAGRSL